MSRTQEQKDACDVIEVLQRQGFQVRHIVYGINPGGGENRDNVVSYCGVWEECSGSGRYLMGRNVGDPMCRICELANAT